MTHSASTPAFSRIVGEALSPRARFGHVGLLLLALAMSIVTGSLLATEPGLPMRTSAAFAVLLVIGLSWVGYAGWVLRHRRTLLANQRVVAARMALGFSLVFTVGAALVSISSGQMAMAWAAALGALMALAAGVLLVRAHRQRAWLLARRDQLLRDLSGAGQ